MKRAFLFLLLLILVIQPAFSMNAGYPAYPGNLDGNQLGGTFDGTSLLMNYDASGDYSYVYDGTVQACFYAYNEPQTSYVELYLLLSENATAGDVITPAYCAEHSCTLCSISFSEVTDITNSYYTVFGLNGSGYPDGTDFRIEITSISKENGNVSVTGIFSATLCRFDGMNPTTEFMRVTDAAFSCVVAPRKDSPSQSTPEFPDPSKPTPEIPAQPQSTPLAPTPTPFGVRV